MTEAEKVAFLEDRRSYFITNCGHKKVGNKWRKDADNPDIFVLACMNCGASIKVDFNDECNPASSVTTVTNYGCVTQAEEARIRRYQ